MKIYSDMPDDPFVSEVYDIDPIFMVREESHGDGDVVYTVVQAEPCPLEALLAALAVVPAGATVKVDSLECANGSAR